MYSNRPFPEGAKVGHYGRKEVTKTVISPKLVYHLAQNFLGELRKSLQRSADKNLTLKPSVQKASSHDGSLVA